MECRLVNATTTAICSKENEKVFLEILKDFAKEYAVSTIVGNQISTSRSWIDGPTISIVGAGTFALLNMLSEKTRLDRIRKDLTAVKGLIPLVHIMSR